ncbi:neurogenic locus notch homolog protein 1-like isoform X2 [Paramacrobiotus metropolitanus]|uniref:neurogenic locus notch homolog protein 1-like isoform X2 n=1 Tax=Paramacrobiotus metropolitanus TaxID=2943436 RepID=UPI002445DFB7|nr:neurogenic locus notch homolog protein 1-like isoform X2 [Paramacrobiotus metropolitanus]
MFTFSALQYSSLFSWNQAAFPGQYEQLIPWDAVKRVLNGNSPDGYTVEDAVHTYLRSARSVANRHRRSIEGGNCTSASGGVGDTCLATLAYTRCDALRSICVCDYRVATKIPIIPNLYAVCLPLAFVNQTSGFQCVPSTPDPCALQVTSSVCRANLQTGKFGCTCQFGGTWPNCTPRLGGVCANTTVCANRIPNSYCGSVNQATLTGTCQCPVAGVNKDPASVLTGTANTIETAQATLVPSVDASRCLPAACPPADNSGVVASGILTPCFGDDGAATCQNTTTGWQCNCKSTSRGRSHTNNVVGICCGPNRFACNDYSRCLDQTQLCDGVQDCNDCSDEKQSCQNAVWPAGSVCAIGQPPRSSDGRLLRGAGQDLDVAAPRIDRLQDADSRLKQV